MSKSERERALLNKSAADIQDISDECAANLSGGVRLEVELLRGRKGDIYQDSSIRRLKRGKLYNFAPRTSWAYWNDNIKELKSPDGAIMVYEDFNGKGRRARVQRGRWTEINKSKPRLKNRIRHKNFKMSSFKIL